MSLFWNLDDAAVVTPTPLPIITTGTVDCGDGVYLLKAGTPLDEDGAVSNDGDAVALVAEDFYFYSNTPTQPKLVPLITAGYVDLNAAEAAAGITYTDACKTALATAGVTLVDGALPSGGGGGGNVLVVNGTMGEEYPQYPGVYVLTLDKTFEEISAALPSCVLRVEGIDGYYYFNPVFTAPPDNILFSADMALSRGAEIYFAAIDSTNEAQAWIVSNSSSTEEEYDVLFTRSGSSWTMNHTYNELVAAAQAHKKMTFHIQNEDGCGILEYRNVSTGAEFYGTSIFFNTAVFTAYNIHVTNTGIDVVGQTLASAQEPEGS